MLMNTHMITESLHPVLHAIASTLDLLTAPEHWHRRKRFASVAHLDDRLLADIGLASEEIIDIRARRPIGASLASTSSELR
jgi:uncharacterized protein YjiS (DUF1127 family)